MTVTGDGQPAAPARRLADDAIARLVALDRRAQMATESEPNGWFAGPHGDPDRFELLGPGLAGGEGNTWRGRYRGELTAPLTLAVKELRPPPHAPKEWPTEADLRRWNDQRALLQYMRIDHLVMVIDIFVGPAPHLPGTGELPGAAQLPGPDTPYVVMEWVPGPTLADEFCGVPATPGTLDQRLTHVQHVAEALHSLHSQTASAGNPTLHRDVKPTNCILDPRRGVVLVDVGTMRRLDDGYDHAGFHTPAYTAPEVLANPRAPRDAPSDLYSLGALAYFCVVGEDPPAPDQPGASDQIEARLLAAVQAARVADAGAFAGHLRLMLDPAPYERPGDARSWSRRLRTLGAVRRPWAALRSPVVGVAATAVVVALAGIAGARGLGDTEPRNLSGAGLPSGPGIIASPPGPAAGPPPGSRPGGPQPGPPPGGPFGPVRPPPTGRPIPASSPGLVATDLVQITAPGNGQRARLCTVVRGTSNLPAGQTLLTSVENLERGDGAMHLQTVDGWDHPSSLRHWSGVQFIGLPHDPVGGRYRIEVVVVSLAGLQRIMKDAGGEAWRAVLPAGSGIAASIVVTRAKGQDPADCRG